MKKYKAEILLSFLYSFLTILGYSYKMTDSGILVFSPLLKNMFLFLLYNLLYFPIILFLEKLFLNVGHKNKSKCKFEFFVKHPFWSSMCLIFLFWLPWIIIKYPGTPGWDFYWILNYFHDLMGGLTQHFPLVYAYFCGYVIEFGEFIGNVNIGLYVLSLIHGLSMLIAFSLVFVYMKKWNIHYKFQTFVLIFFALNPLFSNYSVTIYHDVVYSSFVLIYILLLTDFIYYKETSKKNLILLFLIALMICLTRKNGIYIVIPTQLFLFFKYKFIRPKYFLFLPIVFFYLTEVIFSSYFYETSVLEAMAIPIQSIARYSRDFHDDITDSEKGNINRVLDYDLAAQMYNPTLVDSVRNNAGNYNLEKEDLFAFFRVWFKLFFRHPTIYLESFINLTYQLYYPYEKTTYIFLDLMDIKDFNSYVKFSEVESLQSAQNFLKGYMNTYEKIPLIKYIDDPGYYVWFFFLLLVLIFKYRLAILPMIPLIMTFLCCLAGPAIDYHGRYAFPIIFSILPLFAFYSYLCFKNER